MKKMISSALVIVLTFITVIVMVSLKTNYTFDSINITDDIPNSQERPDGTGLIFEDYDKNINIPVNNQNSTPEKSTKEIKEEKGDKVNYNNYNDYKRLYEDYIAFNLPIPESERGERITSSYTSPQQNSSSNNNEESIENKVSLSDKIYIAKIATNLNLQEISTIRKAINDTPNDWELRKIWNTLKDKLPEEDYEKLVEIIEKYER